MDDTASVSASSVNHDANTSIQSTHNENQNSGREDTNKDVMRKDGDDKDTTVAAAAASASAAVVVEEPEISEYEKRRLEKIKRNQALLASLGLSNGGGTGTGMLGKASNATNGNVSKRPRKKRVSMTSNSKDDENQRVSARKKKSISYKEKSLRAMIIETVGDDVADFTGMSKRRKRKLGEEEKEEQREKAKAEREKKKKEREEAKPLKIHVRPENVIMNAYDKEIPMSYAVHCEYWRMDRERKRAKKIAEKNVKTAELELRVLNNTIQREKTKKELSQKRLKVDYASQIRTEILRLRASKLEKERRKAAEISRKNASVANIRERFRKTVRDTEKKLHAQLVTALPDGKFIIRKYKEEQKRLKREKAEEGEETAQAESNDLSQTPSTDAQGNADQTEQKPKIRKRFTATKIILIDDDEVDDNARRVGGPISEEFSKKIQRSWIMEDTAVPLEDVKSFVPQVGDTVIYYASAHKRFLDAHPRVRDTLNRNRKTVPFERRGGGGWERDWSEKETANEGIICTVTGVNAEFPVDPTRKEGLTAKRYRKSIESAKAAPRRQSRDCKATPVKRAPVIKKTPIWLSVTLNPLVPVSLHVPDEPSLTDTKSKNVRIENDSSTDAPQDAPSAKNQKPRTSPPGKFSVLTYPSGSSTFIVPFTWACSYHARIKPGVSVQRRRCSSAKPITGTVISIYSDIRSTDSIYTSAIPFADRQVLASLSPKPSKGNEGTKDLETISLTWPTLQGVRVQWNGANGRTTEENCWDLILAEEPTPDFPVLSTFDEVQRGLIEKHLSQFLQDKKEHVSAFLNPVSEIHAPFYYTFVPVGICFSRILKRLKIDRKKDPYYRCVASLLSDIEEIYNNCILYNAPNSPIVNLAEEIVNSAKEEVKSILDGKFQEGCIDGRWLNRKLLSCSDKPDCTWTHSNKGASFTPQLFASAERMWIPQAGDGIVYNRELHEAFVALHADSLFYHQRSLPALSDSSSMDQTNLFPGRIVEVRYVLPPKSPMLSFGKDKCPLFELTIRFFDVQSNHTIFWRPCFLKPKAGVHCSCGSGPNLSFIMPLWLLGNNNEEIMPVGLSEDYQKDALLSMSLFRECCIKKRPLIPCNDADFTNNDNDEMDKHGHNTRVADKRLRESYLLSDDSDTFLSSVASPDICIEMIYNRLKNGYYRQEEAILDDIHAAFLMYSCHLLHGRAKSILPILDIIAKSNEVDNALEQNLCEDDVVILNSLNEIRRIHAIALMSANDPSFVSEVYSSDTLVSKKPVGSEDPEDIPVIKSLPIEEIVQALQPDGGNNHVTVAIGAPNPVVKIKVKVAAGLPSKTETIYSPSKNSVPGEMCERVINYKLPILLEPQHYQFNDRLCVALYGSHNRSRPCARCQARGNNFLVCRVRKGHSNIDLDLSELEISSLSKVLLDLKDDATVDDIGNVMTDIMDEEASIKVIESTIIVAKEHQQVVDVFCSSPISLGSLFMDINYPFDTDDNRYTLCGYCGFGGEMICCEKCSRVSHLRCANLSVVPETDWFCHACNEKKSSPTISIENINAKNDEIDGILQEIKSKRINGAPTNEKNDEDSESDDDSDVDYWHDEKQRFSTRSATRRATEIKEQPKPTKANIGRDLKKAKINSSPTKRGRGQPPRTFPPSPVQPVEPIKRGRGRPRKVDILIQNEPIEDAEPVKKRKRGRPPKKDKGIVPKPSDTQSIIYPKKKRKEKKVAKKNISEGKNETGNKDRIPTNEWCPPGWTKKRVQRLQGVSAGAWDNLWISPEGKRYRSRTRVEAIIRDQKEKQKAKAALKSLIRTA